MNLPVQRLDKWLWFARLARTRSACQRLVADGRVRINSRRVAASAAPVRPGDVLTLTLPAVVRVLRITALGERRGNAAAAGLLFKDISPVLPPAPPASAFERAIRPPGSGRPTKRDRRVTDALRADPRNPVSRPGD